jgi:hypothetical protein
MIKDRAFWIGTTLLAMTLLLGAKNTWPESPLNAAENAIITMLSAALVAAALKLYARFGATSARGMGRKKRGRARVMPARPALPESDQSGE